MKHPSDYSEEDRLAAGWIELITKGEVQGLDSLYALYHRPILAVIRGILDDLGAAEEVLQDAFVRAYERAGEFDPELGTPFTWLATIGKRMAIDQLRKQRRRRTIIEGEREHLAESADNTRSGGLNNGQDSMEAIGMAEILEAISPGQREVIELAFLQGYTHFEISKALGKPLGTVKSDLRRGMMLLRKQCLGKDDG